jgi:hypothetical protein
MFNTDYVYYRIIGCGSFISLVISSIQTLVQRNNFDFQSIESSISSIIEYGI